MKVIEYFSADADTRAKVLSQIKECEWGAGKFLYELVNEQKFFFILGENGKIFVLLDGDKVVSFATLTKRDCIDTKELFPWIGFVYTYDEYRGYSYSKMVIDKAVEEAKAQGYEKVYIGTDHTGLYEKYGFEYIGDYPDNDGGESRVYVNN